MKSFFSAAPRRCLTAAVILFVTITPALAQRQMERLGRGIIALRTSSTQVYVGWRLLGNDPGDVGFNLYRSANGGTAVQINSAPLTNTTDYVDTPPNLTTTAYTYSVKPVLTGVEVPDIWANPLSPPAVLPANAPVRQYLSVPIQSVPQYPGDATDTNTYSVKFCWVGDLDGDGEYDFVVDRTSVDSANAHRQYVDAYKRDGTFLWRVNMGSNSLNQDNISPGSAAISTGMWDGVEAYDMDGDGKAEVIIKAANDTRLPDGTIVTNNGNSIQYLIVLDGMTGKERARIQWPTDYISDGPMGMAFAVAYLNGVTPSLVVKGKNRQASGAFNMMVCAFSFNGSALTQLWKWDNTTCADAHQLRITDVNNDGKDEILEVPYALNPDGTLLYNLNVQGIAHGDRFHITDMDPDRPGLETFLIQQDNPTLLATALIDTATGIPIKKWYAGGVVDVGRGVALDLDPGHKGCEMFSTQPGVFDCKGNKIFANSVWPPEGLWWDADLGREFIDGAGTGQLSPIVTKFNPSTDNSDRLYSIYQESVWQPYGGRPPFWGDILGDWREELVFCADNNSDLRIYISKIAATNRIYCLMQNPQYRCESTVKGYVEASYVDYYLGWGMTPPEPPPQIMSKMVWRGGAGSAWDCGSANWRTNWFYIGNANTNPATFNSGDSVLFDLTGSNNAAIALSGALTPGDVTVYAPKDYTFDGSAGSLGGSMKLTKAGAGTLTVTGDHNFTGNTVVWDGALIVNGSLDQSPVTVWGGTWGGALAAGKTGGRISGTGQFSQPVTIKYRGAVTPGAGVNNPGTITFGGGLALEDGSALVLDLSDDPTGLIKTNDLISVTGNLTVTGANHIVINQLNANLPPGAVYPLINYSGALSGSLNNFVVSGLTGIPFALTNPPGQIALIVKSYRAPATISWTGGQGGNAWDLLVTSNWFNGPAKDQFAPKDTVRFDDTGAANPTVNLVGDLNPASLVVDSTANYTFAGGGGLFGPCNLTKTNSGTLTINTVNNTFTGPTVISGGTLVVSELDAIGFPSPLGSPNANPTNLVLSGNATLRVTSQSYADRGMTLGAGTNSIDVPSGAGQLTFAGAIVGNGVLQKVGTGALALTAASSYTGGTIIQAGSISLGGANGAGNLYGIGTGPVTFINGTLSIADVRSSYAYAYNFIVPTGGVGTINCDGRSSMNGSLTGGGTLSVYTPYVRTDFSGNWSAFTGQINATGGNFRVNNSTGYPLAKFNVGSAASLQNRIGGTPTISIGELSGAQGGSIYGGTGNDGLAVNWSVGGLNTSATFACSTYNNVGFIKVGTGAWTWTGTNISHTGQTTVNAGTLLYNANGSNSTSIVTVGAAGTLGGTGIIGGNTTVNGVLAPGAGIGTLTFRGNLTIVSGGSAVMEIQKSNGTKDLATVAGTLTYGGALVVTNLGGTLANGDTFKIFNAAVYTGSFSSLGLPPLADGLAWDTTALNVSGTLAVIGSGTVPPPAAPSGLAAAAVSSSQINLTWTDNSTNENNFLIERSPDNASFTQTASVAAGVTNYPDAALSAGTTYYYRVRASNAGGNSAYSGVASATTLAATAGSGEVFKANNLDNLNLGTSWTNGAPPGAADVAVWNSIVTAANTTLLGGDTNWAGIRIANPAGAVTISAGSTLTLGASGIDMSAASQNLTLSNALTLGAAQTWNIASNTSLTISGSFTAASGKSLAKTGAGQVNLNPVVLAAAAPDGITVNQGTLRVNGVNSTVPVKLNGGTYDLGAALATPVDVSEAGGRVLVSNNRTLSGSVTGSGTASLSLSSQLSLGGDILTGFNGGFVIAGNSGIRLNSSTLSGGTNVSFDLGAGTSYINRNSSAATVALGSLAGGPLTTLTGSVIWSIGGKNLDSIFAGAISGAASIVKVGNGTLTLSGTNTYTGTTTISNGTLQIGTNGTTGTLGTNNVVNNGTLVFNRADAISDSGVISGAGSLAQIGDGILMLSKAHTYSGATAIQSGTLALTGTGSIANSTGINIFSEALLDVSGHTGGGMTLASGQTLSGNGVVNGNLTIGSGAKLAPGNSIGALTFSNTLTLSAGSTTRMEISKLPLANDAVNVPGRLNRGGALVVTNISGLALAAGDSFPLFNAGILDGLFSGMVFPALGTNLMWDTNSFLISGTLTVISTAPPAFNFVTSLDDGNFRLTFSGPAGQDYELRGTTNLMLMPVTLWDLVGSGTFGNDPVICDDLSATNSPQKFYRLLLP